MANSQIAVTEGSGKNIASYSFSETTTKEAQRIVLNNSSGTEMGTVGNPLVVSATIDTTGLATSAKQDTGNTSLSSIDGKITAVNTGAVVISSGSVTANAGTNLNTSSLLTTAAHDAAFGTAGSADAQVRTIQGVASMTPVQVGDNSSSLTIDYATTGSGTATGAIRVELPTNGTGVVGLNAGTNNIGDVDIVSGTITTVSTVTAVTTLTGGGIAHDSADSGNPHKVGYIAYSPDGTTPGTAVAELDRTNAKGNLDGQLFVQTEHPRWGSYHVDGSSALTDATVAASPGAGFQTVITNISFSSGAATAINMFLEEGASKIYGPIYLEAVAGRGFCTPAGFRKHVTAATAVTITTSAAIAHSVDIQYETIAV